MGRTWRLTANGHRVSLGGNEKVLKSDTGDGYTSLNTLKATKRYVLHG